MKCLLRIAVTVLAFLTVAGCGSTRKAAGNANDDIVVLYENDVHCAVDGYAPFKFLKDQLSVSHRFVTTVSSGDFVQGGSLGAATRGRNMIDIMNEVGYDFVTLGNHEFDYGIPRQQELINDLNAECLCCNFIDLRTGAQPYKSYSIVDYDGFKVAYIGMSTPYTINSSKPTNFMDADGKYVYSFSGDNFCEVVQTTVDKARSEGADFVVVLSHLGDESEGVGLFNSIEMVAGTYGIDVVLDGHSHTIMPSRVEKNAKGQDVVLTSTGTKFQRMGVLTISRNGKFSTELIDTAGYQYHDTWIDTVVERIKEGYRKIAEKVVFKSDVAFKSYDGDGNRLVRNRECPIGNFCADAFREVLGADIGIIGGGSIRADLPQGDVTFNDVYTMFPFENTLCRVRMTGALFLDVLEFSVLLAPAEFGGFQQVSGVRFEYDPSVPTPVKVDQNHNYIGIEGDRRVKKVEVFDREEGKYMPLDPSKVYTIAALSYLPFHFGDGFTMFKECISAEDTGMLDTEAIEDYVERFKDRHVGTGYEGTDGRIKPRI